MTAVGWRCGPVAGGYSVIQSSCAYRQICSAFWSGVRGFSSEQWSPNSLSKTLHQDLYCVFLFNSLMKMLYLILGAQIKFHSLLAAYLAVKTDDLCTVFVLKFRCRSDKAARLGFMSA